MELLIVFLLMLINGFFAMAEIAVVSSKRVRLEAASRAGKKGARSALSLLTSPNRFFQPYRSVLLWLDFLLASTVASILPTILKHT